MINCNQLRKLIIKPALIELQLYSMDAEELLVFTCAVESDGGTYLKQNEGPALGIYQMEPVTYNDLWQNFIFKKISLNNILGMRFDCYSMPFEDKLIYDLRFATAMARVHYSRFEEPLPRWHDTDAIWEYYKKYYNTSLGASTKNDAIRKFLNFKM